MHKCKAVLVCCIDFRFHDDIRMFIEEQGLGGNVDIVSVPGGVKDQRMIVEFLKLSKRLHGIEEVYLINHQECGAYGPTVAEDEVVETETHRKDLLEAKQAIMDGLVDVEVFTYFLDLDKNFNEIDGRPKEE